MRLCFLLVMIPSLFLVGCGNPKWENQPNLLPSTVYRPDLGTETYQTYRWFSEPASNPIPAQAGAPDLNGPFRVIQAATESELASRGYRKAAASETPNFWVGFIVAIRNQEGIMVVDQYAGLDAFPERDTSGRDAAEILGATLYDVANLVVEVVDAQNHRTVLQSRVTTEIDRSRPPEETKHRIDTAIGNMFTDFPPAG